MDFTLEGGGALASKQKQPQEVVYSFAYYQYPGYLGDYLYLIFQQEKRN
jgi:hypothetical protein